MPETTYTIIVMRDQTVFQSWARDASSFALFLGLIGIGWVLGSDALQWVGAVIGFIVVAGQVSGLMDKHKYDLEGAQAALDRIKVGASHL